MRKIILTILITLAITLAFCACGSKKTSDNSNNNSSEKTESQSTTAPAAQYFDECKLLPTPDSIVEGVVSTGNVKTSTNGVVSKIAYNYSASSGDVSGAFNEYLSYLKTKNINTQKVSDNEYSVISNQMKVASLKKEQNKITVDIIPEDLRVVSVQKKVKLGSTETLEFAEMTFDKIDLTDEVYPKDSSGVCLYYPDETGYKFIALRGSVKNLSSEDLSSRYINSFVTINDKYTYSCEVIFGANPAALTDYAITSFENSPLYMIAKIPDEAISTMTSGVLTIQFNDNFERGATDEYAYTYSLVIPK